MARITCSPLCSWSFPSYTQSRKPQKLVKVLGAEDHISHMVADTGIESLRKLVSLMLCVSVQCENREEYVKRITRLSSDAQHTLMATIMTVSLAHTY